LKHIREKGTKPNGAKQNRLKKPWKGVENHLGDCRSAVSQMGDRFPVRPQRSIKNVFERREATKEIVIRAFEKMVGGTVQGSPEIKRGVGGRGITP